jgi:hypothetical protein
VNKKYLPLYSIFLSLILLGVSVSLYPGGSQANLHSVGYDWKNNYLSNLFGEKAMNGPENASRPWAIAG